jgi:hypothetical protein
MPRWRNNLEYPRKKTCKDDGNIEPKRLGVLIPVSGKARKVVVDQKLLDECPAVDAIAKPVPRQRHGKT